MADNRQWLYAGMRILGEAGLPGLTIERLMERVGLTKGSFYHHFGGMGGYKTALLSHYEQDFTTRYIEALEQDPGVPARQKLERLMHMVCAADDESVIETIIRAWALQDAEVREAQERIDRQRLDYTRQLCFEITGDRQSAQQLARVLYLILIGNGSLLPPLSPAELRRLYKFTLGAVLD